MTPTRASRVQLAEGPTISAHAKGSAGGMCAGFTLIELVATMIIIGIMAVVALPRFDNVDSFRSRGFRDQTLSTLRFAQKTAIAQRRAVCVAVGAAAVTLTIDTSTPPDDTCDAVLNPPFTPAPGTTLGGGNFSFLRMGETSQANGNITLTVGGEAPILIDAVSGYVR